jgi:hypothetical protein
MKPLWMATFGLAFMAIAPADEKAPRFAPGPASSYSSKQTNDKITIAAVAYDTEQLAHTAFGKLDPYQHGVLPVLVIIKNDTGQSVRLEHLQAEYEGLDGSRIEPTPVEEVKFVGTAPQRPRPNTGSPLPPGIFKKKKNPLDTLEIVERAFVARMLPANESAYGFFYFQAKHRPGSKLYLTGITEAMTGKGIVFFEIPLDATLEK